jgi:hypothetical protein
MISKFSLATMGMVLAVGAALVLTGCSSAGQAATASKTSGSSGQSRTQGQGQGGFGGGQGGGTVGKIAAVDGTTLQVQDDSSQTAVTYSSSTALTKAVKVALSAVKVGECITASSASSGIVTTVAISQPADGTCTGGFRGAAGKQGARPSDRPRPSDFPSGVPSNRPSGGAGRGNFVLPTSGEVTAVSGSTITVDALDFQTQKTTSKKVTVDSATTFTEQQKAAASDLTTGECVVARGTADDSGTVTATAITVSDPVDGSCTTGFGGRGGFPGRQGGQGGGSANGTANG